MRVTPNTAEAIDAPPPHVAYANAPDLRREMHHPDAITLDPGRRPYVRQEYAAWTAAGRPGTHQEERRVPDLRYRAGA
ncbi:hypothetical protein ACIQWL_05820 [Streptomyces mirabilis]|uniref:hypothetical protein n=1 Tax=Streptomyces mirabilis TaxID=68239 RepID=UPI0037F13521